MLSEKRYSQPKIFDLIQRYWVQAARYKFPILNQQCKHLNANPFCLTECIGLIGRTVRSKSDTCDL